MEAESGGVARAAKDTGRILHERQGMQRHQGAPIQIALAARHVDQSTEDRGPQRDGHGIHREVAPEEILAERGPPPWAGRRAPRSARDARRPRRPAAAAGRPRCGHPSTDAVPNTAWTVAPPHLLGEPPREGGRHRPRRRDPRPPGRCRAADRARTRPPPIPPLPWFPQLSLPASRSSQTSVRAAGIRRAARVDAPPRARDAPTSPRPVDEPDDMAAMPHQDDSAPPRARAAAPRSRAWWRHLGQLVPGHLERAETGQPQRTARASSAWRTATRGPSARARAPRAGRLRLGGARAQARHAPHDPTVHQGRRAPSTWG